MLYHDKVIDAFRDDVDNPDTDLDNTASDLSDLYRLYLNAGLKVDMVPVDLLIVIDRSGSMDQVDVPVNDDTLARDSAVTMVLNCSLTQATSEGLIGQFLDMNPENQIAVTSFFGTQNISTTASAGYDYTKDSSVLRSSTSVNTFVDAANVYNNGTNYEAGLLSADDLFAQVANNGHKKVMVFISDGVPTFYIDDNGNRQGTGVSKDINGTSLETSISPDVLKYMSGEDHFFGVTTYQALYDALELIITNDIGFFHPLLIDDALSAEVELPDYVRNPEKEMPVQTIDGQDYIGVLQIPAIDLELPVISRWSDAKMRIAPCRYSGSLYQNNLVIVAHNFASHFGGLKNLREGDAVIFVDMDGNVFSYAVTTLETLNPT